MEAIVATFVAGAPRTPNNKASRDAWKGAIREQTMGLPRMTGPCKARVAFHLTAEAYDTAGRFGPDLDNLLKPLMDALKETVLAEFGDECILELHATKQRAADEESAGVHVEFLPV